jgi:predicted metal-dependent hydrolase
VTSLRERHQFKARVREWSDKLGVRVHSLALRPMRNKWASCSSAGNLNFSDDLLALDQELADYVIVHELLHFYVPNHGRLWKSLMRLYLGDYESAEARLRSRAAVLTHSSNRTMSKTSA